MIEKYRLFGLQLSVEEEGRHLSRSISQNPKLKKKSLLPTQHCQQELLIAFAGSILQKACVNLAEGKQLSVDREGFPYEDNWLELRYISFPYLEIHETTCRFWYIKVSGNDEAVLIHILPPHSLFC